MVFQAGVHCNRPVIGRCTGKLGSIYNSGCFSSDFRHEAGTGAS